MPGASNRHPTISLIFATHNRREVVLNTLAQIERSGLLRDQFEIVAVDNASTDGTPEAIAHRVDQLIRLRTNKGSCAKTYGVDRASGRFIVFLDDDSFPHPGTLSRMIARFESDSKLAAAGFQVHLPDGQQEGAALPDVFVGCGVGFRADALRDVGGLDRSFFMQAEEYDLSFRLAAGGWNVRVFDDLHVTHLKTIHARRSERTTYFDTRNNLRVIARYLPSPVHTVYRDDCVQRYHWLAQALGHETAFSRGVHTGRRRAFLERSRFHRWRLPPEVFEHFFRWNEIERRMADLAGEGIRRIVLADLGKNIFPYVRAAELARIEVAAIGDDRFAAPGRSYRGIGLTTLGDALDQPHDAVVVSNTGPVHAAKTHRRLQALTSHPIHCWFGANDSTAPGIASIPPVHTSDDIVAAGSV